MTTQRQHTHRPASIAAHALSIVFSPLFAPTYAILISLWCTYMRMLPIGPRIGALIGVFLLTAIIPAAFIALLMKSGKVSDADLSRREERTSPFCASILCYIGATVVLLLMQAPGWIWLFMVGATATAILDLIITRWWKISAHCSGIAGLTALIVWLSLRGMLTGNELVWMSFAFAATGALAWARLYLRKHTPLQTLAGVVLSFTVVFIFISL